MWQMIAKRVIGTSTDGSMKNWSTNDNPGQAPDDPAPYHRVVDVT